MRQSVSIDVCVCVALAAEMVNVLLLGVLKMGDLCVRQARGKYIMLNVRYRGKRHIVYCFIEI